MDATTALIETKKLVDRVEYDTKVLTARLESRRSAGADADDAMGDPEPMDIDEGIAGGDGEAEYGRAQSIVSTRSARSRKPVGVKQLCPCGQPKLTSRVDAKIFVCIVGGHVRYSFNTDRDKTPKTQLIYHIIHYLCAVLWDIHTSNSTLRFL